MAAPVDFAPWSPANTAVADLLIARSGDRVFCDMLAHLALGHLLPAEHAETFAALQAAALTEAPT